MKDVQRPESTEEISLLVLLTFSAFGKEKGTKEEPLLIVNQQNSETTGHN